MRRTFFLSLLLLLGLQSPLLSAWAGSYETGVSYYKNKNYSKAVEFFQAASKQNPDDLRSLFYMGLSLSKAGQYNQAREAFELVIQQVPPNDPMAVKARNNITYLTNQQMTLASSSGKAAEIVRASQSGQTNYLSHVIASGKVIHFSPTKMPLKVYISSGQNIPAWDASLNSVILKAMQAWSTATQGKVKFAQTYQASEADIVVRWQKNFSDSILGVSPFQMVGNTIVRSDVHMATFYPDGNRRIPLDELQSIALHELGHAIGMKGHSPYRDDIMYYSAQPQPLTRLSQRDINTIRRLYEIDADVANNSDLSTAKTKEYYELYQKGYKAQTSGQAAQAISYYRQAIRLGKNQPEAKYNLGALLINEGNKFSRNKQYSQARRNYQEAVNLFQDVLKAKNPPKSAQENLEVAQKNLATLSSLQ